MNRHILIKISFAMGVLVTALSSTAVAQKLVPPPAESASIAEVRKWIVDSLPKYASYKTRSGSMAVSEVRFEGCTLKFMRSKKVGTTSSVTEGAKRTVSSSSDEVAIEARVMRADAISLGDHLYPELQTLEIGRSGDDLPIEIVVRAGR